MSSLYEKVLAVLQANLSETKFVYIAIRNRKQVFARASLLGKGYVPDEGSLIAGLLEGIKLIRTDDRTPEEQAQLYDSYGDAMESTLNKMNHALKVFRQGEIVRFVIDVASGAIYYRKMQGAFWMYEITVNQYFAAGEGGVDTGDVAMADMVSKVEQILRGS